jgi:3-hydroxy-9,10-secoandrosta-1,3,5(10)-triene-9,17-dione monooxygenase reductase component
MDQDQRAYRSALGAFATGVTVVSTAARDGFHATTANSFTSVSLSPRLVLVCLTTGSRTLTAIRSSGVFAVSVLSSAQEDLSAHFASRHRAPGSAGFAGTRFTLDRHGCPRFTGSAASFACRVHEVFPGGDHVIVVGEVAAYSSRPGADPLLFHEGRYARVEPAPALELVG